jgi:photosystem II stability/assembly factor-like uncharacterized protein
MAKAGIVYVATDDGLVIFSDPASIGRWRRIGHELAGSAVAAVLAEDALKIDVAVRGAGLQRSDDGGQSWRQLGGGDLVALAAHPAAPQRLFALSADARLARHDDAGWQSIDLAGPPSPPAPRAGALLVDPHAAELVIVALSAGEVWASVDAGAAWGQLGGGLPPALRLAASPGRPNTLFATAEGGVWRAGASGLWATTGGQVEPEPGGALAALPGKTEALLVATRSGIAYSTDDGDTWADARFDAPLAAPVSALMPAAYHIDTAWAGTPDGRLLLSSDRGRSWATVAQGLAAIRAVAAVRLA